MNNIDDYPPSACFPSGAATTHVADGLPRRAWTADEVERMLKVGILREFGAVRADRRRAGGDGAKGPPSRGAPLRALALLRAPAEPRSKDRNREPAAARQARRARA